MSQNFNGSNQDNTSNISDGILFQYNCTETSSLQRQQKVNTNQSRVAICLEHWKHPTNKPSYCYADGEMFTVCHTLNSKSGCLFTFRHIELRDMNIELLKSPG